MYFDVDPLGGVEIGRERDFDWTLLTRGGRTWWMVVDCKVTPWVLGQSGELAVEEGHLRYLADEHVLVGAIGRRLEEDVSSIVG